jgi:hypothetical protein
MERQQTIQHLRFLAPNSWRPRWNGHGDVAGRRICRQRMAAGFGVIRPRCRRANLVRFTWDEGTYQYGSFVSWADLYVDHWLNANRLC